MQATATKTKKNHAHHWRIDEAAGPVSRGECLSCGTTREFRNFPEEEPVFQQRYGRRRTASAA